MKDSVVSYNFEMALDHMCRVRAAFPKDEDPYYNEWITHCINELDACYSSFLKEFFPENARTIRKETKRDVKEFNRRT